MRFKDKVGYELPGTLVGGVWTANIVERDRTGDVLLAVRNSSPSGQVNDNVGLQNRIKIVADAFATENVSYLKYVRWNGNKWAVISIDLTQRPSMILTLGGVYDGGLDP